MSVPKWAVALLRRAAPAGLVEDVLGDLEESHNRRVQRHGTVSGTILTAFDALDMTAALLRERRRGRASHDRPVVRRTSLLRNISWLDFKLGIRMLARYPGLTVVGGLAIAFAIAVGAGAFDFLNQLVNPRLPLDDGDRIVGIRITDAATGGTEARSVHDFVAWRDELTTVEDLGAFRTVQRNLITADGLSEPIDMAEISASAFRVTGTTALLGRTLLEADERMGGLPVAVIGYRVWQTRFDGDPEVIGRTVSLGGEQTTIVGVMPQAFAFPVAHDLWLPLRVDALDHARGEGPAIRIFGRLADGVRLDAAQAEVAALGMRAAADYPRTHEHLRPNVLPWALSITAPPELGPAALLSINVFFIMLLVLVCGDVALLMFARAASRESEIIVRNALGASRGRIVSQLFAEALVLGGVAVVAGLAAAGFALRWWLSVAQAEAGGRLPFWFSDRLAPQTVLYAVLLALLAAVIAGVVPALRITGRSVASRLRQAAAGGDGTHFGGVWTAVIVAQVAVTVAFPATAFFVRGQVEQVRSLDVGFPADEYLSLRLEMDVENVSGTGTDAARAAHDAHLRTTYRELERRLEVEPRVTGVTFTDRLPRTHHPARRIQTDMDVARSAQTAVLYAASPASVDIGYFGTLGAPILAGRGFLAADLETTARVVIVNESFVQRVLGGRNALGRQIRYAGPPGQQPGPWYEIVGVVPDLGIVDDIARGAGLYHAVEPGARVPLYMAVRVRGEPEAFGPRLRAIATALDPTLRLHDILPLDEVGSTLWLEMAFLFRLLLLVSSIALLLSNAAIYAVTAFAVSRRTREIGIRVALGADARRVAIAIFRRPLMQVAVGVVLGGALTASLSLALSGGAFTVRGGGLVVVYSAFMLGVCLLACIVPVRRALRIEPTVAMRENG